MANDQQCESELGDIILQCRDEIVESLGFSPDSGCDASDKIKKIITKHLHHAVDREHSILHGSDRIIRLRSVLSDMIEADDGGPPNSVPWWRSWVRRAKSAYDGPSIRYPKVGPNVSQRMVNAAVDIRNSFSGKDVDIDAAAKIIALHVADEEMPLGGA